MNAQYPYLFQFFGGYFHQDWMLDSPTWQDVVRQYAKEAAPDDLHRALAEIEDLLHTTPDDQVLEQRLLHELGCEYDPRPDLGGPTYREWLAAVAGMLHRALRKSSIP